MSRNIVIAVIVILALAAGGWFLTRPKQPAISESTNVIQTPASTESASPASATEGSDVADEENLVTISSAGFSPKEITISAGETVVWMNSDAIDHTVNSAPHPTHTAYPPLNLDTIKPGDKKSLNFPEPGTYKYHDHLNPSLVGSIIVE